jgi:hypothetical protein
MNDRRQEEQHFTAAKLAGLPGMPKRPGEIPRKMKQLGITGRAKQGQGGGKEYPLSALPIETREAIARRMISTAAALPPADTIPLFVDRPAGSAPAAFSSTPDARAEQLAHEFEAKPDKQKAAARDALAIVQRWAELVARGFTWRAAAPALAEKHGISPATLYRWWRAVKCQPRHLWLYLLVDGYPGRRARQEMSAEAWEILKADYLRRERPTAKACIDRLRRRAKERPDWVIPSDRTLERRLDEISEVVKTMSREGPTAAKQMYPSQQRLKGHLHALAIINGDGYKHNLWVRFPDGEVRRAQTWYWQDVYSSKILGWRTDKTEHTDVIRLSFGDLIEAHGIPEAVVVDNTYAAANKTMTGGARHRFRFKVREEEPLGVFQLLNVPYHPTTPAWGQAKPIERAFGVGGVGEYIDKAPEFAGAWTGSNTLDKPEYDGKHRAIELADLERVIAREIAAWNARAGRRGAMHTGGKSCDALFAASYEAAAAAIRRPTEAQRRLWLLATEPVQASSRNGEITLNAGRVVGERLSNRYWSEELAEHAGRPVVARFDPKRLHQGVHVYTLDGRYICYADCVKPGGFNDANAGREHSRARGSYLRGARQMLEAETRMDALEAGKALAGGDGPVIPAPAAVRGKVVRGDFRDPLQRPHREAAPDTPEEARERAALAQEMTDLAAGKRATVVALAVDDPGANYRRWCALDRRLAAGEAVTDREREWHASYRASGEWATMDAMAQDFPQLKEA